MNSRTSIWKILKTNQFFYFLKMRITSKDYKRNKKAMKFAQKSKEQIRREMKLVEKYWRCKPYHYIRYELFNKNLSEEELINYIPPYYFYNYYTPPLYKNIEKDTFENKEKLWHFFKNKNIPTPEVIAIYKNDCFINNKGERKSYDEIISNINNGEKLFFKPANGRGGTGIIVLKKKDDNIYIKNKQVSYTGICKILKRNKTYIIQKGIIQRKDISNINPSSVNTLRAVTQIRNGKPHMPVCVMRIGVDNNDVDNSHQGGISVQIDTKTGIMGTHGITEHGGSLYKMHPNTGFIFANNKITKWEKIKTMILNCTTKVPELKEIAWDVAIVDNGILVIELNLEYGIDHLQCCCSGMRKTLNVFPKYN